MTENEKMNSSPEEKRKAKWIDFGKTVLCFSLATFIAYLLKKNGDTTDAMAVIYMLTVVVVSRITDGYVWGILASLGSIVATNYIFTYPYMEINFSLTGYSVTFTAMLLISIMISALTTQNKKQAEATLQMAEKLQETYEEQRAIEIVAEKERLKSNLLRAISHDLRTPLTTIIGASSTILENGPAMDKQTLNHLVKDINEESQWLLRMVENLLAVTHISEDTMKVIKSPEVGEEIIAEAIGHLKSKLPGHQLTVKVPDDILIVPMDGTLIEQVIINLLDNSIKYSGPESNIFVGLSRQGDYAVFEVSDDGKGLSEQDMENLFEYGEKKSNGPSSDSSRGFGIGLPTCKSIILAHSGEITLESAPGKGCRFLFKLPLTDSDEENPTCEGEKASENANGKGSRGIIPSKKSQSLKVPDTQKQNENAPPEKFFRSGIKVRIGPHGQSHRSQYDSDQIKEKHHE